MISMNGHVNLNLGASWVRQHWGTMGYEDGILHSTRVLYVKVKKKWVICLNEFLLWVCELWRTKEIRYRVLFWMLI